jgi:hypothetical protein
MPYDIDTEPIIIRTTSQAAIPAGTVTGPDWTALLGRVANIEGIGLVDLTDVDATDLADEMVLVYDAASGTWKPQTVVLGIRVSNGDSTEQYTDIDMVQFDTGLTAVRSGLYPNIVTVNLATGTTSTTAAAGNHTHTIRAGAPFPFPASGSLSSGTRTLTSGTVTGLTPANTYVLSGTLKAQLRGEGAGAGYSLPRITINGNTVSDVEPVRTVSGVPHTTFMEHEGVTVTGVSSVAVSATLAYSEGDPIYVGAGKLVIRVDSNR